MEARKSRNWMELYGMELDLGWMIWDTSGYCQESSASGEIRLWYWRYHLVLESCMGGGQITSDLGWTHRRWSILQKRTMRCRSWDSLMDTQGVD